MSHITTRDGVVSVVRAWSDNERIALAKLILEGNTIADCAVRMSVSGSFVEPEEAMREVMCHGGILPYIRYYGGAITPEDVRRMQDIYHAHARTLPKRRGTRDEKLRHGIARLASQSIYDDVVESRFWALMDAVADTGNVNRVPYVFIIRGASCSEKDSVVHDTGTPIPTIGLRCEVPRVLRGSAQQAERRLYFLLIARLTREIALVERHRGPVYDALRRSGYCRMRLFVTDRKKGKSETVLIAESAVLSGDADER